MRRAHLSMAAAALLCLAVSCVPAASAADLIRGRQKLRVGNLTRTYILHLPAKLPKGKMPLLIALHGYTGTAPAFEIGTGFNARADAGGFAVVYPDGTGYQQMWNAGGPYEYWTNHADDVGFIARLIDTLAAGYPIDTGRICVAGHSNGAMMAYRLARELPDKVAAIAPVAGMLFKIPYPEPEHEVTVLHIHALDDATVPYKGYLLGGYEMMSAEKCLDYWIKKQNCDPTPKTLLDKDGVLGRRWVSASGHGDVYLYTVSQGGHSWPRLTTGNLEATELIGEFVTALRRRG